MLALEDTEIDGFLDCVLEPIACPSLDTTTVPLVHPSYQDIWIRRLGYTPESYRDAVADTLGTVCD